MLITILSLSLVAGAMYAQQAAGTPPAVATATTSTSTDTASSIEQDLQQILEEPAAGDAYRYDPQGRRDPFRSLIGPTPKVNRENAPPGPPGFMIDEIDLQGVIRRKQGLVAMIKGPDNNGYTIQVGDKVFDGEVIRIAQESVVFRQEVSDPTRIERFREVIKELVPPGSKRP